MKASHKETYSFALKALSTGDLACIDWPFGCGTDGYPTMRIDGKMVRLNRWICEKAHGAAPHGVHAAHSCGNERCINPGHLYWATPKRNNADKIPHGTTNRGERHGNSKLSDSGVLKIRADKRAHALIAKDFGVDRSTVSQIKRRASWRHI